MAKRRKKFKAPAVAMPPDARTFVGIDPGASGGIVCLFAQGPLLYLASPMPRDAEGILAALKTYAAGAPVFAVLERVGGYVAGNPTPGSAMFNFGANFGMLRMALAALEIPAVEVIPHVWQKALGIEARRRGEAKADWKRRLRDEAARMFPTARLTLKIADAFLIAAYARQLCTKAREAG